MYTKHMKFNIELITSPCLKENARISQDGYMRNVVTPNRHVWIPSMPSANGVDIRRGGRREMVSEITLEL
jgi:hypothetical protein